MTETTYGPWIVLTDAPLYHCIKPETSSVSIVPTTDTNWVLKLTTAEEVVAVLLLFEARPRNCVQFPPTLGALCGSTSVADRQWYAMRRYSGSAASHRDFCREGWQALAVAVLAFLEDLHCGMGRVHGDIKPSNILVDTRRREFVVSDYETVSAPNDRQAIDYDVDSRWYYLAWGAEPDCPVRSWRMDLTALGYLLADLTWPAENTRTFYRDCLAYRQGGLDPRDELDVMAEVLARRDAEMARACPESLRNYFEILELNVLWTAATAPPRTLYRALTGLFV
jgi:hypothetical protein